MLDWNEIENADPDALGNVEALVDTLLQVEKRDLQEKETASLAQLFSIVQTLLKIKCQELSCAYEMIDKAGVDLARTENAFQTEISKLESELEMVNRSVGGRDTRFLRDEIRQLESHLERKEKELVQLEKEMMKEKKANEELSARVEDIEDKNRKLKRENDQLRQDVEFYRRELDQRVPVLSKEEGIETQRRLNITSRQLYQCMEELQRAEEEIGHLKTDSQLMKMNLEVSVREMEKMTDEYNKMKIIVQQSDASMDQLRKERDHAKAQVRELMDQIQRRAEEDDPVMAAVSAKVEEWKRLLSEKDDEVLEYQQMNRDLREKLKATQMDSDKNNILALQQAVQERDNQIKMLSDQVEQYTNEMEKNTKLIEEMKKPLRKEKGPLTTVHLRKIEELQAKLLVAERKAFEAEELAELAEKDARLKDKDLSDTLTRIRVYESGTDGLEAAIAEIKQLKDQIRIRDDETEAMTKEINKLEMEMNDLLDQNEALRERLGLNPEGEVDLTEFRRSKALKQRQYKAENQVLMREIERLEEERLDLKKQLRVMVKEKGMTVSSEHIPNIYTQREPAIASTEDDKVKKMNEHLRMELNSKQKELELTEKESSEFKAKLNEILHENKHLEEGIKEILVALQDSQKKTHTELGISVPSLERLVTALEMRNSEGTPETNLQSKMQIDYLADRNNELRQEMKGVREDAALTMRELTTANEKIMHLESELETLKSKDNKEGFKALFIPEELTPSIVDTISSLNDYAVRLLLEVKDKEDVCKRLQLALKEYRRKLAVIRHQQGLLYEEYQRESEAWHKERESLKEANTKLEEQKKVDEMKVKEFAHWLDVLEKHPTEIKRCISEAARKMTVLRVNETSLTRYCTTLLELEQHLRKENNKLKDDFLKMEISVTERISYLQRYKDMAVFKMTTLQKALDKSVPSSELEKADKQYINLTVKYRDLLQKDNHLIQRTTALEHLEQENVSLREHISSLGKELQINKERVHILEQTWDHRNSQDTSSVENVETNSQIKSVSKMIATLEMKELNERQRAEHAQRMYEHLRHSLKQVEQRNFDLENKFLEVSKQNMDSQRVEQELRDELANCVSNAVNDSNQKYIADLEKMQAEMKMEISNLQEVANVAKMQVSALEARQQSRENEMEALRRQTLDYQAQSEEKALIAKLYQHIVALQLSETTALCKLETTTSQLCKVEAQLLRAEQQLDEKEKTLWQVRQNAHGQAKHLRQTIQSLRRQFSGALPLAQQERFFQIMVHLKEDHKQVRHEALQAREQRRNFESKGKELELKIKGLDDLMTTLKDTKGAQKVIEWHRKLEEARLLELKSNREVSIQREEIKYLKTVIEEQERSISALEDDLNKDSKIHEEHQLLWEEREVELERQLEHYEKQQNQVDNATQKFEQTSGTLPDPMLPVAQQLNHSLKKIKELIHTVAEKQATCNLLEQKLKEKEEALWKAEQNVLTRDKVINELRLRLPNVAEKEKILATLSRQDNVESQPAFRVAQQTINSLQGRLNQKEEVLKKYQHLLARTRQEQEDITKKHKEDMQTLQQKLELFTEASLGHLKQTALELMKKPFITIPTTKHLARLAELEQTVAEQENSLTTLMDKLKEKTTELDKQRHIMDIQARKHVMDKDKLEESYKAQKKNLQHEAEELGVQVAQMEKQLHCLQAELDSEKEANLRSPSQTMKNLVEGLKSQLCLKEKQQRALSKALLELRAEMTSHAEHQTIISVTQREEELNIQQIVDKHTKELQSRIQELNEKLLNAKESVSVAQSKESAMRKSHEGLVLELQKSRRAQSKLQAEKTGLEDKVANLKLRVKELTSNLQCQNESEKKGSSVEGIKKGKLETSEPSEVMVGRKDKDKMSKEETTRWEEAKKWQARVEKIRKILKEKESEVETLSKQLITTKDLYTRLEEEKINLQRKLSRNRGVTTNQVMEARSLASEKEIEELRRRNAELEQRIQTIKQQQALPRDVAIEDLHLRNRYLEDKILCLESELAREPSSHVQRAGSPSQKKHTLQAENLRLSAKNLELCLQLEQATKDVPRLKDQVSDLKDMCNVLIKEKATLETKFEHISQAGGSGKTAPELEKTIGLMKKVVERVQRENEALKKVSAAAMQEQLHTIEQEHEKLKSEYDKLKGNMLMESRKMGLEKIVMENHQLRRDIKKEAAAAEKLKLEKACLEVTNQKLQLDLDEANQRLSLK
ncbi:centrosomal protein of 290 kDa [Sardina pilchardus]|uniref:centrosomal protein of 290 kDa n=1 Tax=Sardina pilchardus TaxID=27697 RepID=UPI002E0FB814